MNKVIRACMLATVLAWAAQPDAFAQQPQPTPVAIKVPGLDLESPRVHVFDVDEQEMPASVQAKSPSDKKKEVKTLPEDLDPTGHIRAIESLGDVQRSYLNNLHAALVKQDFVEKDEAKAHFDNCAFDEGLSYIASLLEMVKVIMADAQRHKDAGDRRKLEESVGNAFYTLGQALHAVQDFYSHTDYVERMHQQHTRLQFVSIVPFWTPEGRLRLKELRRSGLISGVVKNGQPNRCPAGTPTHSNLAKDFLLFGVGAERLPRWNNMRKHEAAVELAKRASAAFVRYAYREWPLLRETAGKGMAVEVLHERRDF